jgi:hypothetical protein
MDHYPRFALMVMLGFMRHMYSNRRRNGIVIGCGVVVFAAALWLVRSQATRRGASTPGC